MSESSVSYLLQQLLYQAPMFLVYLAGLILALVYLGRHPAAAGLTLAACGLLLVTALGVSIAQASLIEMRESQGWDLQKYGMVMSGIGFGGSLVRALALAMLLVAVFVGRKTSSGSKEAKPI